MTNSADRRPFSMPYVAHFANLVAGSASGAMIARAPWPSPVGKYFVLRKLVATSTLANNSVQSGAGAVLNIWDQDTSNSTPVSRGSGGGPLIVVPIAPGLPASGIVLPSTTILDIDACPQEFFQAGVQAQLVGGTGFSGNLMISMEFDVI